MTENDTTTVESTEPIVYEKGSWQEALQKSTNLKTRAGKANKTASVLLWKGARDGIEGWLPNSATDVSGEGLYNEVIEALGTGRKGDASKIKTVAIAVRKHSLDLASYANLSKAYAAAIDLTKGSEQRAKEDDAAETAVAAIEPPKTTSSVDGAALLLLSKGVDGAVVAILDALGANNEAAHRAFARAMATEIASRIQAAKPKPAPKTPKPAPVKKAAAKKAAAPVAAKAKGKPVGKPAAKKAAAPVEDVAVEDEGGSAGDLFDEIEGTEAEANVVETPAVPVAKKAGKPVVRRPRK